MPKKWLVALGILLCLAAAEELLLPVFVEQLLVQGMAGAVVCESLDVKVEKRPAFFMLGGFFDGFHAQAKNVKIDKIVISDMSADLTGAQFDMNALLSRHVVVPTAVKTVQLAAQVTQDDLARYLNQSVRGVRNASVVITPEKVQANSNLSIGPANLSVALEGNVVSDGQKVKFVTQRFQVNNNLLGRFGGNALTEIPLFDVNKLPFAVQVRDVVLEEGKIVIKAGNPI